MHDDAKRKRRSTDEKLDKALGILNDARTVEQLLDIHERECEHGADCPVADAMRRRLRQLRNGR